MRAAHRHFVALAAVLLLAACDRAPTLPKLNSHDVIVAFGDSLTHGTGASSDTAYPAVLASLTGRTVINAGVPGDTTASALQRLPAVLAEHQPRLVLLCLGGNDMLRKQSNAATENNLRLLVQSIRASGAEVMLIAVPEPKLFGGAPDFYQRVAEDMRLQRRAEGQPPQGRPHPRQRRRLPRGRRTTGRIPARGGRALKFLLALARLIDALTERIGRIAIWLVLIATLISAGNALIRYLLGESSNAWLEIQWYLFGAMFLLGAGYTLKHNGHVRIDILYNRLGPRGQAWIDLAGGLLFLLPMAVLLAWLAWPMFHEAWLTHEMSPDAGGLLRWPVKLLLPVGFALLALQGVAEVIKRIGVLSGHLVLPHEAPEEEV